MYNYIKGILVSKEDNLVVIENNGIGYEINMSALSINKLAVEGEHITIHTYQVVREDEISLYGFCNKAEKNMFLNLITVNGIGPKIAIGILSNIELQDLEMAIISGDSKILGKVKGIGGKTAERIVLELKDKIQQSSSFEVINNSDNSKELEDAIIVLESLGISRIDAVKKVRTLASKNDKAEDIIAKVLKDR